MPAERDQRSNIYNWRSKFGGLDVNEARRLKQLEENAKLKRVVADQALDITMLKDLVGKMVDPQARRTAIVQAGTVARSL